MNVTSGQLIEWLSSKLRYKFMYWQSQSWIFHVCLKVLQCIMEPMILYYLPLLAWTKKALHFVLQPLPHLMWRMKDKMGITWVAWNHLGTSKRWEEPSMDMMAHLF